ncbi:MAG: heparan-alpha-glucosaminide N-acetyltransferase domain-containing protein [Bacteroidota bacterium]|nr:heparan-alpha-glucosaminide N-acetyltransferase domain-containing protein [Bacteroidota bacterium]
MSTIPPDLTTKIPSFRIHSIDILRGLVMVIMALDHTRDFFHISSDPTNLLTTTPILFFTRWITHFCAPIFVFLSGTSAFLSGRKKTKNELSVFLLKRGLWLIIIEVTIFNLFLTFDPTYHFIALQVLWVIGFSMIILAAVIYLPLRVIFFVGCIIVFGHNFLDVFDYTQPNTTPWWWGFLHQQSFFPYGSNRMLAVLYPLIPWPGVMMLGYCLGSLYVKEYNAQKRQKFFMATGIAVTLFFILLRFTNLYGDPQPWSIQRNFITTILSFFNTTKYPPSLLFLSMTLGPALIFLSFLEKKKGKWTQIISVYGRVPFFYFLLHFFVLHFILMIIFFINGHSITEAATGFLFFRPADFGYPLLIVYLIWMAVVISLYPVCKKYDRLKSSHKNWWLSYL